MAPKDFVDIHWNYFYSIKMDNEREDDDEIDLTNVQHVKPIDSFEHNESDNIQNLRLISGEHKWINTNNDIHVEHLNIFNDDNNNTNLVDEKNFSIISKTNDDTNHLLNKNDLALNYFDVQLQVNDGQLEQAIRYEVFSSILSNNINRFKLNQYSQTIEPEMDMDHGNGRRNGNYNGYSQQYNGNNNNNNNNDDPFLRNRQTTGPSGNGGGNGNGDGNGSNPNRNNNNNNSRRPKDDDTDDNEDDDDNDNETNENLAHRLGFRPINNETIRVIGHLRSLTNKQSFDRRDFDNVQYLINELIHLQHLENSSPEQLEKIVHHLKLHRILRTKSHALAFIQERLPQRNNIRSNNNNENNSNVFDVWRERERRSRLDSKDSLEEEGQNNNGQQFRDVTEINHPTPPIIIANTSNGSSKVKQMAKHIDTKTVTSHTGDYGRSSSPSPTNFNRNFDNFYNETFIDDRLRTRRTVSPVSSSDQHRVRQMIDRLESSTGSSSNIKSSSQKKASTKKIIHDDYSDGGGASISFTSPSSTKRISREDNYENNLTNRNTGGFIFHHKSPHDNEFFQTDNSRTTRFELDRDEIRTGGQRTTNGITVDEYVTSLLPGTETSISMVRDVRARLYEDHSAVSRTDVENVPVKFDVETLYILEQKADKRSLSPSVNVYIPTYEYNRGSERHDFAMQTTMPTSTIKPSNRPIGTQVDSFVEQNTVAAQTTDSLHRRHKERQPLPPSPSPSPSVDENETSKIIKTTTTTTRHEIKRRHSSHTSEDENDAGGETIILIEDKDNFELKPHVPIEDESEEVFEQRSSSFGQVTSRLHIDQLRDINRHVVRRQLEQREDEYRSSEVYEVHTRGACKCLVVSHEEKTQYGSETRFEKQLKRIEHTYTDDDLKATELHVIVASSDAQYELVRRDYGPNRSHDDDVYDKSRQPSIIIHYYTKEGHRMRTEEARLLEHLPLFIRCEIEYELNRYGSAQIIILSVTNTERRQMNVSVKKEIVNETVLRTKDHFTPDSPELESEISKQLSEPISLVHLVDYSSRDEYNQINTNDLRRVSRIDVTTSLRIVQRYRTIIHRLCQLYRSRLRLTQHAELQRHLVLVARDEYYLLDLAAQTSTHKREHQHVTHQPFDYAKYRRDMEQQRRILEQHYRQTQSGPPLEHPKDADFYLSPKRRALIEREIHSMRESIRPHEHAPPRYKHEPARRSLSISYSGAPRYVRARIIHVKDYFDESQQRQTQPPAKEQELFVRVDDYINESAADSLRRSYSTDYLNEDGPRSRIRYIRIPGETIRIEETTTYEYQGVMYADLPYSLKYWNILSILDRDAREGRQLGSTLPHVIVNDPYQTVIPPLTQHEIRQTAQQVLSPGYNKGSYTDRTLRWFLSRDNRPETGQRKNVHELNRYRLRKQQYQRQLQQQQLQEQQYQQKLREHQYKQQIYEQQLQQQLYQQAQDQQLQQQIIYQQPVQQEVIYQQPIQQEVIYQQPVQQEIIYQQPVQQEIIYQQPVQQEVIYQQPVQQEIIYQQPAQQQILYQQQVQQHPIQQPWQDQHLQQQLLYQKQVKEQLCQQQLQEKQLREQQLRDQLYQQQLQNKLCQQQLHKQHRQKQLCQQQLYQQQIYQPQILPQPQRCQQQLKQANARLEGGKVATAKKYYVVEKVVRYEKLPDRLVPISVNDRAQSIDDIHQRSSSTPHIVQQTYHSQNQLHRSKSQTRHQNQQPLSIHTPNVRPQLPSMHSPLSRHQSVHELHATSTLSHPPSPSPSLHSLHSNHNNQHHRRPVAFNNRFQSRPSGQHQNDPTSTEIYDSQTGEIISTAGQGQLTTEVLGLLNKYNL